MKLHLLLSLLLSIECVLSTNTLLRRHMFDRRTGAPDSIRDTYSCIACNYLFEEAKASTKFFTDSRELETRKRFSMERKNYVDSLRIQSFCDTIQDIPERHKSTCRNIARHFFENPVKVALCVLESEDSDSPGQSTYCGCAAGDGMPSRGAHRKCPTTDELVDREAPTAPLSPRAASASSNILSPSSEESSGEPSRSASSTPSSNPSVSSRDARKCGYCKEFMDGRLNINDKIFYKGRATTTPQRVAFNKERNAFLDTLHPRTQCPDLDSDCVSVVNFFRESSNIGLCLQQMDGSEESAKFCGCVAKSGTPMSTPFVCPE